MKDHIVVDVEEDGVEKGKEEAGSREDLVAEDSGLQEIQDEVEVLHIPED